jgi:hypothetical protein
MFYNPYLNYDEYEKIINPYFLSTLTPASKVYPYLSSSAKNIYLSPHSPYLLSPTISIEKDSDKDSDKDKKKIKINFPPFAPLYQSYIPRNYSYQNVNNDRDLIRNVTKYFFEGTMNRWLYSDFQELLKYLVIKKGKVHIVSNREELSKNKLDNNMNDMKLKVKFISEYVMTKYDMRSFLKKLSLKSGVDLWKFKDYKSRVKKSIFKKIKSKLEKLSFNSEL